MVLHYIRLDSSGNDLMIQEYALDDLIRESIRKFSSLFINRNVRLEYRKVEGVRVTDKKYFACVLEQILSNAIKYNVQNGSVRFSYSENAADDDKLRLLSYVKTPE